MTITSQQVTFRGGGGNELTGRLELPATPGVRPRAYALFAHCFTCSKDSLAATRISRGLAEAGIAVLRFDFTGLGGSGGDFANTDFSSNVDDLLAAAEFLSAEYSAPALLVGHSLGGTAVLAAAGRIPQATAVATIGAPCAPEHVAHLFRASTEQIEREGAAEVDLGGRPFRITREFLHGIREQAVHEAIGGLRKPLLVMHAPLDQIVGIDNASRIFTAAKHPKSFVSLDDADHLLSRAEDSAYAAAVLAAWASRFLATNGEEATPPPAMTAPPGKVLVAENEETPYGQSISAGGHALRADEPERAGGRNTGPGPYDLLMAALGACTSMTIRMYAQRKKWPLEHVSVLLEHEKIHASDCAECETREGKLDRFTRQVTIRGPLDDTQRARLLEIADKCPVHRTLHNEVSVRTYLTMAPSGPPEEHSL